MRYEKSVGAVLYTIKDDQIFYLLIQSLEGIWGFAKGHAEGMELEKETALREVEEETGLHPTLIDGFRMVETYEIHTKPQISRQVVYYLGYFENEKIQIQKEELQQYALLPLKEAIDCCRFGSKKHILRKADEFISTLNVSQQQNRE